MTARGKWTACLLLAAATAAGNGRDFLADWRAARRMARSWEGRAFRGNGPHSDLRRELAEQQTPPGAALYLMVNDGQNPSPMTRIIHQTLAWSRAPEPVVFGPPEAYGGETFIITSPFDALPEFATPHGSSADFEAIRHGPVSLWRRRDNGTSESSGDAAAALPRRAPSGVLEVAPGHEIRGLAAPVLAFLAALLPWERLRRARCGNAAICVPETSADVWQAGAWSLLLLSLAMLAPVLAGTRPAPGPTLLAALACGAAGRALGRVTARPAGSAVDEPAAPWTRIAVAGLAALFVLATGAMACSHTFLAPNGLGVQGGKARLLYLAGGLPGDFFDGAAYRTLQPAYPPGFALLTLACYATAGGCGEYLTQLLPIAIAACILALLASRSRAGVAGALWAATAFLARPSLRLATQFYAEPLMALLVVAGWETLRGGGGRLRGWILLGAAGWIKNEGLLFLPALWIGLRLARGGRHAPWRGLAAGLLLPLAWHLGCRLAGGRLYDFAPLWAADPAKLAAAFRALVQHTLLQPWHYGYVFPLALLAAGVPRLRRAMEPSFRAAAVAVLLLMLSFCGIFAISGASDFEWHLASLKRLLWAPSLLLLRECLALRFPCAKAVVADATGQETPAV